MFAKKIFICFSVCLRTDNFGILEAREKFLSGSMNHLRSDFYNGRKVRNGHFDFALKEEVCSLLQENIIRTCEHCDNILTNVKMTRGKEIENI